MGFSMPLDAIGPEIKHLQQDRLETGLRLIAHIEFLDATHRENRYLNHLISSHSYYSDQVFNARHLDGGQLVSSEFYDCDFNQCSFVESIFQGCKFVNCLFRECDISLLQVPECSFSSARFLDSKVLGVNWTQADWATTGLGKPLEFLRSIINHSTFIGLKLKGIQITNCVALEVDFREADLSQADFTGTDLSRSMFKNTILIEADLSQACNYHIDPGQNALKGAKFSMPEAMALLYSMDIELIDEA
jgi:uncharacterized protein YjbI with pentapeptide repeats